MHCFIRGTEFSRSFLRFKRGHALKLVHASFESDCQLPASRREADRYLTSLGSIFELSRELYRISIFRREIYLP